MKVAIVGFGKTNRHLAPYEDPSWEIWTVNDAWTWCPRISRLFEPHARWIYEWSPRRPEGHVRRLAMIPGPVYMIRPDERVPNSVAYPLAEVVADIGRPYLTSSIAYAVALAIHERAEEIGLWGVDMAAGTEYQTQRPGCEWLLGLAAGRGIRVTLPDGCNLLSGELYGRGGSNPDGERLTPAQMDARHALLEQIRDKATDAAMLAEASLNGIDGQIRELRWWLTNAPEGVANPPEFNERLTTLEVERGRANKEAAKARALLDQYEGMLLEANYWRSITPQGAPQDALFPEFATGGIVASRPSLPDGCGNTWPVNGQARVPVLNG